MAKREPPLRIPLDFDETLRGLLQTPPPPEVQEKKAKANTRKDVRRKPAKKR